MDEFERLIDKLKSTNCVTRRKAIRALGDIRDTRAIEPLIKALGDEDEEVWCRAIRILGMMGEPAMLPLIDTLQSEDRDVRVRAALALAEMRGAAVNSLIQALGSENGNAKCAAALALSKIGDPRAVEPVIQLLADEGREVRKAAFISLCDFHDDRVIEPLLEADERHHEDKTAMSLGRWQAFQALEVSEDELTIVFGDPDEYFVFMATSAIVERRRPAMDSLSQASESDGGKAK